MYQGRNITLFIVLSIAALLVLASVSPNTRAQTGTATTRVSVASDGTEGNNNSYRAALSTDGRYAAFSSAATNLVAGDTNGLFDVFIRDQQTATITRVSVASDGTQAEGGSSDNPVLSDNGRYVAFWSLASNLVSADTNNNSDIFVYDRQTAVTTRVSVASDGTQSNGWSQSPAISADGRYVAFWSGADNLVSGDTNGESDVFVHDQQTDSTTRVSVASDGAQGIGSNPDIMVIYSNRTAISSDGRYVVFTSYSTNLADGDTNNIHDIFVHDQQAGVTTRVSVASDGTQSNGWSDNPAISADGRYVAFDSAASNLVSGDTNGQVDSFLHDRQTGITIRVSVASDGAQASGEGSSISADGRYVAFWSRPGVVYVHDQQAGVTTRVSVASDGTQGNGDSYAPTLSADGHYVAFESAASNLVSGDTNNMSDIFVYDLTQALPPPTATPTVGPPPPPTTTPVPGALNLTVARVEVTQAVQDAANSVPLVANRLALARAHIILAGANELGGVEGRLHILRNGAEVAGSPFGPNNAGRFRARPTPNPGRIDDTLNFLIPTGALQPGTTTFWIEINPNHTLQESNYADNRSVDTSLTTVTAQALNVVVVPIAYQPNGQGPIYHIDPLSNDYWHANLNSIMPTPHLNITFHREVVYTGNVATEAGWADLLHLLTIIRSLDRGSQPGGDPRAMPKYYGLVPAEPVLANSASFVGYARISGLVGAGISYPNDPLLTVHELGHTFGLLHAPCGGPANPDPSFPNPNARTGLVGVDIFNRIAYPASDADLMSYCHPAWISRYSYVKLLNVLAGTSVAPAALNTPQAQTSGLLVLGTITGSSGQIDTALPLDATDVVTGAGVGSYELRLLDGADATLLSYAFTPEAGSEGSGGATSFSIAVPPQAGQATVELWHGVTRLSRVALAGSAPTLSAALDPLDPATPTQRRMTWQASRAGGGTAPVSVRYSPDDGVTWQTQAVDRTDGAFIVDTTRLPASADGLLELIATDIGQATMRQLRLGPIANKSPLVRIDAAQPVRVDIGATVALSAIVSDLEDGSLPDSALTWRDASGTVLGSGPTVIVPAGDGIGQRTLTLTAHDSVGAETVAVVRLQVGTYLNLPMIRK